MPGNGSGHRPARPDRERVRQQDRRRDDEGDAEHGERGDVGERHVLGDEAPSGRPMASPSGMPMAMPNSAIAVPWTFRTSRALRGSCPWPAAWRSPPPPLGGAEEDVAQRGHPHQAQEGGEDVGEDAHVAQVDEPSGGLGGDTSCASGPSWGQVPWPRGHSCRLRSGPPRYGCPSRSRRWRRAARSRRTAPVRATGPRRTRRARPRGRGPLRRSGPAPWRLRPSRCRRCGRGGRWRWQGRSPPRRGATVDARDQREGDRCRCVSRIGRMANVGAPRLPPPSTSRSITAAAAPGRTRPYPAGQVRVTSRPVSAPGSGVTPASK